jgi:cytidylate kinase
MYLIRVSGQTGSGKTHTMMDEHEGLYVLAANDIFALLDAPEHSKLTAFVSFYEIYQGALFDLLGERKKLFAREDGNQNVVISGLTEFEVRDVEALMNIFEQGSLARSTGKFIILSSKISPYIPPQVLQVQTLTHHVLMLSYKSH